MFTITSVIEEYGLTLGTAVLCTAVALFLGFVIALVYMTNKNYSKNMAISLVVLPTLVEIIIMLVNGNLGAGIAVLGAFSLVRFRSTPGSSREICVIVFAMALGLALGMGYITFACMITAIISLVLIILFKIDFGGKGNIREVRITIPENLDYTEIFDDIFSKFTKNIELQRVKTTNLGSMYELKYEIEFTDIKKEKEFIDALRCKNGNLPVICNRVCVDNNEL